MARRPFALHVRALFIVVLAGHAFVAACRAEGPDPSPDGLTATTDRELRRAIGSLEAGQTLRIAPGVYAGGLYVPGLRGEAGRPITIAAVDPDDPPVFRGGRQGLHLVDPVHVIVRDLVIEQASDNGLNIDDGGEMDQSARHIRLENLTVRRIGPEGNRDGIKLSGLRRFEVVGCTIERWGDAGSGIDMVGCHEGRIDRCTLRHGDAVGSSGVQAKGGSSGVRITRCRFEHAGRRAVHLGGSTGEQWFRPALEATGNVEARDLLVAGCTFIGSNAPIVFTNSVDCRVERNTIYRPARWVMRILQEQPTDRFVAVGDSAFTHNVIVWRSGDLHRDVNVGPNTRASTFRFGANLWYCADAPDESKPDLPAAENLGIYGRDPMLADPARGDLTVRFAPVARRIGADSYKP